MKPEDGVIPRGISGTEVLKAKAEARATYQANPRSPASTPESRALSIRQTKLRICRLLLPEAQSAPRGVFSTAGLCLLAIFSAVWLNIEFLWTSMGAFALLPPLLALRLIAPMQYIGDWSHAMGLGWLGGVDIETFIGAGILLASVWRLTRSPLRALQVFGTVSIPLGIEVYFYSPGWFYRNATTYGPHFITNEFVLMASVALAVSIPLTVGRIRKRWLC